MNNGTTEQRNNGTTEQVLLLMEALRAKETERANLENKNARMKSELCRTRNMLLNFAADCLAISKDIEQLNTYQKETHK